MLIFVSIYVDLPTLPNPAFWILHMPHDLGEIYTNQPPDDLAQLTDIKVDGTVTGALTQVSHFFLVRL